MAKYPYVLLPGEFGPVYKPWIRVQLNYRKTHKITPPIVALIDSGADVCFCAKNIGIWLGIQFSKRKQTRSFTAANKTTFKVWEETIRLCVSGRNYNCPFFFSEVLPEETPIILGQLGFFDHFKIIFDVKNKTIEVI